MFYFRYRWGNCTISISKEPTTDVFQAIHPDGELLFAETIGGEYDGDLHSTVVLNLLRKAGFEIESYNVTTV